MEKAFCTFWWAIRYHCLCLFCICKYLFFSCILFLTLQLLPIWCCEFNIFYLTLSKSCVVTSLSSSFFNMSWTALHLLSSFGTYLLCFLHTSSKWFSFLHLEQLLPHAGHLCVLPPVFEINIGFLSACFASINHIVLLLLFFHDTKFFTFLCYLY